MQRTVEYALLLKKKMVLSNETKANFMRINIKKKCYGIYFS